MMANNRRRQQAAQQRVRRRAALEHMRIMGFKDEVVSAKLTGLLETYGNDGWVFIESDSYKVLVEAILEEQQGEPKEPASEANNEGGAGSSTEVSLVAVSTHQEMDEEDVREPNNIDLSEMPDTEEMDSGHEAHDYYCPGYEDDGELKQPNTNEGQADGEALEPQPTRRKPCYGWICDDGDVGDDDEEFIMLPPAAANCFSED